MENNKKGVNSMHRPEGPVKMQNVCVESKLSIVSAAVAICKIIEISIKFNKNGVKQRLTAIIVIKNWSVFLSGREVVG